MRTIRFEVCYLRDQAYEKELFRYQLSRQTPRIAIWCMLSAVFLLLVVRAALTLEELGLLYTFMLFLCLKNCLFREPFLLQYRFKREQSERGQSSWTETLRFGDAVEIRNGAAEIAWDGCLRLEDRRDWMELHFRQGWRDMVFRKSDFIVGTAEEFKSWLAETHPEVRQKPVK